ncbi:hypothetical protein [Paracoccus sp. NSM]|uniref:hypothetical protein n=1 Tax=Paracoccus sp. NSM TaxID=3457784 RepID=UPI004036414B
MLCTRCGEEADLETITCGGCGAQFRRNPLGIAFGIALLVAGLRGGQATWLAAALVLSALAVLAHAVPRRWYPFARSARIRAELAVLRTDRTSPARRRSR